MPTVRSIESAECRTGATPAPLYRRDDAVKALGDALAAVSKPSKGGVVRDALIGAYPRLAQALEAMFERLSTETTMKVRGVGSQEHSHSELGS